MPPVRKYILCGTILAVCGLAGPVHAESWTTSIAGGADLRVSPRLNGNGFFLLDMVTPDFLAGGDFRIYYNTDTLQLSLERIPLGSDRLELSLVARGEALYAGILPNYYQRGEPISDNGFLASYVQLDPQLQWHVASKHTLEVRAGYRQWFFRRFDTAPTFALPPNTAVFEPRLGYVYWGLTSPGEEWQPHRLYPRVEGLAFGISGGLDLRSDKRSWGVGGSDLRNVPKDTILLARQWLMAGVRAGSRVRLQLNQYGSWGHGEDDLTRNRVGGMNPYVIPLPGIPWASVLSERLLSGQLGVHVAVGDHELGALVAGGFFNDMRRVGLLDTFYGAGGAALAADLRFGAWQVHARAGWAFPLDWLARSPQLSFVTTFGRSLSSGP